MQKYTCTNCSYLYNPFLWEENIEPGVLFENLPKNWICPHCGECKDGFMETEESVQEMSDPRMMTEQEASHIPFYREQGTQIIIQIGTSDSPHEIEENHFIEYVGLFETDSTPIEITLQPEDSIVVFENPNLDEYEVRLSCNVHGTWRGVKINK